MEDWDSVSGMTGPLLQALPKSLVCITIGVIAPGESWPVLLFVIGSVQSIDGYDLSAQPSRGGALALVSHLCCSQLMWLSWPDTAVTCR